MSCDIKLTDNLRKCIAQCMLEVPGGCQSHPLLCRVVPGVEHLLALASEVKPPHLWSTGRCTWGCLGHQEAAAFAQLCFTHLLDPEPDKRLTQHREPMSILQGTARLMMTLLLPKQRAYGTGEARIFSTA